MGAAIINKFMDMMGIGGAEDEDIYDNVEDYDNEEIENDEIAEEYRRNSNKSSKRTFRDIERGSQYSSTNVQTKVIPMSSAMTSSKMVITQPTCYDEVQELGEYLKVKKTVIVNLENSSKEDARRILDFLSGSAFMIDGSFQRVSNLIYLITPRDVEIQNDLERNQYKQQKMSFSWLK